MGMNMGGSKGGPQSEINVTPLVDICLVLLIIFMVMTPKNVPEITVRLPPEKKTNHPPKTDTDTLVIGLTKDGAMTLNHNPITSKDELSQLLESRLASRDKRVVFIDFDDDAVYGTAVDVLDLAKRAGAQVLGIVKKKNQPTPDELPT